MMVLFANARKMAFCCCQFSVKYVEDVLFGSLLFFLPSFACRLQSTGIWPIESLISPNVPWTWQFHTRFVRGCSWSSALRLSKIQGTVQTLKRCPAVPSSGPESSLQRRISVSSLLNPKDNALPRGPALALNCSSNAAMSYHGYQVNLPTGFLHSEPACRILVSEATHLLGSSFWRCFFSTVRPFFPHCLSRAV